LLISKILKNFDLTENHINQYAQCHLHQSKALRGSWCSNECNYIETSVIPKFSSCVLGSEWFKERGQWADRFHEPLAGTIVFFDWDGDNITDHVGIVQKC